MKVEAVLGLWQDRPAEEALTTAAVADDLGYRRIWIGEMATFDAFALATAVALRTRRIEPVIGPLAVSVRTAATIAMGVASVACLAGRPTHVALGTSSPVVVERWHGRSRAGSAHLLEATAHSVRALLRGDRDPTSGFRLRLPPPASEMTVAAFGPQAIAVAATAADRMVVNMVTPDAVAGYRAHLDAAGGRDVPLAAWLVAAVDPSPGELTQIRAAVVAYLAAPGYGEMFAAAGYPDLVSLARSGADRADLLAALPDGFERSVGLVGSRGDIDRMLGRYREAGLDAVCVVPVTAGDGGGRALETLLSAASADG